MQVEGHGPVAVFESGLGQSHTDWARVVPALAACLTTVTYDRPGIGASPPLLDPAAAVFAATVADNLLARLRERSLHGPYLLVAHSLGGLYMQALARNHPDQVAGAVLIDTASQFEPPGVYVTRSPLKPGSAAAAEEAGVAQSDAALLAGPPFPPVPLYVIAATDHAGSAAYEAEWREIQKRIARMSPKGHFRLISSGHYVQIEHPAVVIDAVLAVAAESGMDVSACRK